MTPPRPPAPPVSADVVRRLARAEYDFAAIDAALSDLAAELRRCWHEVPRCLVACRQLAAVRRMLRRVLADLDGPVSDAVAALEAAAEPPPF